MNGSTGHIAHFERKIEHADYKLPWTNNNNKDKISFKDKHVDSILAIDHMYFIW